MNPPSGPLSSGRSTVSSRRARSKNPATPPSTYHFPQQLASQQILPQIVQQDPALPVNPQCEPISISEQYIEIMKQRFGTDVAIPGQFSTSVEKIRAKELSKIISSDITHTMFSLYSHEEIKRMSGDILIAETGLIGQGTVNDPRMGMSNKSTPCGTCSKVYDCSGHYGRIEFHRAIVHPFFIRNVISILNLVCNNCGHLMINEKDLKNNKLDKLTGSDLFKKLELLPKKCSQKEQQEIECVPGSAPIGSCIDNPEFDNKKSKEEKRIFYNAAKKGEPKRLVEIEADQIYMIFSQIPERDLKILGFNYDPITKTGSHPKNMILKSLLLIPPSFRKTSYKHGKIGPGFMTELYRKVVEENNHIKNLSERKDYEKTQARGISDNYANLIELVGNIFEKDDGRFVKNEPGHKSIKSLYTGKKGEIRDKLTGKRVTSSARSVLGPGSYLEIGEAEIPYVIAKQQPVRELVTNFNNEIFTRMIREGKIESIERGTGQAEKLTTKITEKNRNTIALSIGDYVFRPLVEGDFVILNRQPTIHKGGIMGHRVVIGKTNAIRINPNAAAPYNADFDGDEMNIHIPQNEEARRQIGYGVDLNVGLPILTSSFTEFVEQLIPAEGAEYNIEGYLNAGKRPMEIFFKILNELGENAKSKFEYRFSFVKDDKEYLNLNPYSGKMLFSLVFPNDFNYKRGSGDKAVIIKNGILIQGTVDSRAFFNSGSISDSYEKKYGHKRYKIFYKEIEQVLDVFFGEEKPLTFGVMNLYANILTGEKSSNMIGLIMDSLSSLYKLTSDIDLETGEESVITKETWSDGIMSLKMKTQLRTLDYRLQKHGVQKYRGDGYSPRAYFSMALPEDFFYKKGKGADRVVIKDGVLISGIITKDHVGVAHNSIIQHVALDYSSWRAGNLLTDLNSIALIFLETNPLSITGEDIFIDDPKVKEGSEKILAEVRLKMEALGTKLSDSSREKFRQQLINEIVDSVKNQGQILVKDILVDSNNIKIMVKSGAKGSLANTAQMIEFSMRGQEFILGDRPKKSLPGDRVLHFNVMNDPSPGPESQGFCIDSYSGGLNPANAFIHAVAARIGGVNTAKSTAKTGYTSNKIHYALADLVSYTDGSVRNTNGQIVQYSYGDDDLDPQYLMLSKFKGNEDNIASPLDVFRTMRNLVMQLKES